MKVTRANVKIDRMWKRRSLQKVERVHRQNKRQRTALYAKRDRAIDRMRIGLKDFILDTASQRRPVRHSVPECPRMRWK
jgi:hypothetical protein